MKGAERVFPRSFIIVILLLEAIILAGGLVFHRVREERVLTDVRNELFAVARLKADQIGLWQRERLGDGGIIMESPFLVREAERLFAMGGAPTPNRSGRSSGGFACTTAIPRSCF